MRVPYPLMITYAFNSRRKQVGSSYCCCVFVDSVEDAASLGGELASRVEVFGPNGAPWWDTITSTQLHSYFLSSRGQQIRFSVAYCPSQAMPGCRVKGGQRSSLQTAPFNRPRILPRRKSSCYVNYSATNGPANAFSLALQRFVLVTYTFVYYVLTRHDADS
jgi:hypothetical protein